MAANRTILILEGMPMAHLKAYVPNFPKHPWKRSQSLKLRELCPSKVGWSWFVSLQKAVFFSIFWEKKDSHGQTVHFGPHSVRHIRKAEHLRIKNKWLKFDFRHPMERQIFGDEAGLDPALILAMCLRPCDPRTNAGVGNVRYSEILIWALEKYISGPVWEIQQAWIVC